MEIAKFIFQAITTTITVALFFGGIWKAYAKKIDAQIEAINEMVKQNKDSTDKKLSSYQEKTEKRIDELWQEIRRMQNVINENYQQRLSVIEGELKGVINILKQIQGWFINNTPSK